jgi:microcystin-dependent protein
MTTPYVGEIRMFSFPRIPTGWFSCDGSLKSISDYEVLYTLLGTTYGGNGQTTFGLPNLMGASPIHQGTGQNLTPRVLGQPIGTDTVTLLLNQMPQHNHILSASTTAATNAAPSNQTVFGNPAPDTWYFTAQGSAAPEGLAANAISQAGGSQPHDNLMPTLCTSICIAWAGVFPSQG